MNIDIVNSMVIYEAKELLAIIYIYIYICVCVCVREKELTIFHKSMNMNRKGATTLLEKMGKCPFQKEKKKKNLAFCSFFQTN